MKKKPTYKDRFIAPEDRLRKFEQEKRELSTQGLSFLEYEKAVRELAFKYRV